MEQSEQDPLIGQRLERYQITQRLGGGGMGAVYKARDLALQRDVAIKILHEHYAAIPHFQDRFLQEGRTAARLDHPGIVRVFDFGVQSGRLYIVMEFIPGRSLRQRQIELIQSHTYLPVPDAIAIAAQVAEALDYAHRMGVFHRDIKPDNIMLKPRLPPVEQAALENADSSRATQVQAILTDLGLAKLAEGGLSTIAGIALGTPAYMSPEQLKGEPVSARSDVYALGVLLYEILAGRPPFPVQTLSEALRRVVQEPPPPLRYRGGELPPALETAIFQALAKEPERRFASAGAFAQALGEALAQMARLPFFPESASEEAAGRQTVLDLPLPEAEALAETRGGEASLDFLEAALPTGELRRLPLGDDLLIGREQECNLVLADGKVSRRHARVERSGAGYRIVDLGSSNGTFLDGGRLAPFSPVEWLPAQTVRIGATELRLKLRQAARPGPVSRGAEAHKPSPQPTPVEEPPTTPVTFQASFMTPQLSVPGAGQVVIANQGAHALLVQINLRSQGGALWFEPAQGALRIEPGQQKDFRFNTRPNRQPLFGQETQVSFAARLTTQEGASQILRGAAAIRPRLPVGWVALGLGLLALAALGGVLLLLALR